MKEEALNLALKASDQLFQIIYIYTTEKIWKELGGSFKVHLIVRITFRFVMS